jgi:hypothetical protein
MPSPFQQQSFQRKLTYVLLIPVLFTATYLYRDWMMKPLSERLEVREQDLGEVELTGSAVRLTLTGARGFAVCGLWWGAIEKQRKHEWNELEMIVRSVIKLQPHFVTPWLFQSWNLAYNVAVESDRTNDKYYYVTRGVDLLGQGERQNRNHPDMRFFLGFYNQHKIGLSDEANTMRSLFQLSCIDPRERDPERFRTRDDRNRLVVDLGLFEEFCQRHPFLVRRLRDSLRCETPDDVIDFLQTNKDVPSRFQDVKGQVGASEAGTPPLAPEKQFPLLPPAFTPDEPTGESRLEDDFDCYAVARAWYQYSLRPMPPPDPVPSMGTGDYDRRRYRMPRYMSSIIFRGYPARAQSYVAEAQEKEGWFDREGWLIKGWFPDDKFRAAGAGRDAVVGDGLNWAGDAWTKAHNMWKNHGESNGLYLTPERLAGLRDQAEKYVREFGQQFGIPELPAEKRGGGMEESYAAYQQLFWYERNRSMTNFPHFYYRSLVEAKPETIAARKAFFKAEQLRRSADYPQALQMYNSPEGIPAWRKLLLENPEFRNDGSLQEETYEVQMKYMDLLREDKQDRRNRQLQLLGDYLTQAALRPPMAALWLPPAHLPVLGLLDIPDPEGQPLVPADAKDRVRTRMGLPPLAAGDQPPPPPTPDPTGSAPMTPAPVSPPPGAKGT